MMILGIVDKLNEMAEPLRDWIAQHSGNPFLWLGFFLAGIAVFFFTYETLNRNQ